LRWLLWPALLRSSLWALAFGLILLCLGD